MRSWHRSCRKTVSGHAFKQSLSPLQGFLVKLVLSQERAHSLEVGDKVADLLDALNLLLEEGALQEVTHL